MTRWYVYALTQDPAPVMRAGGRRIETVKAGTIFAAVSRMNALPPLSEEALARQHAIVARLAARVDAILPMRFGALVEMDALQRFATQHRAALQAALDLVRGREQMTVRVFGPSGRVQLAPPPRPASGTEYLRSRRATAPPLPPAAALVRRAVRNCVEAERSATSDGLVRATLWHLVTRGGADDYRAALERVAPRVPPPFQVVASGPWPPFAFAPDLLA